MSETVVFRAPGVFGLAPLGIQPALTLQAIQRRQQRPGIHLEDAARDLLHPPRDAKPVHRFKAERFQDEHVKSALNHVGAGRVHSGILPSLLLIVKRRYVYWRLHRGNSVTE